jgi:hypothetical protein
VDPLLQRLLFLAAGLIVCFRGYAAFRFSLVLTAFLVGAHAVAVRPALVPPEPLWLLPVVAVSAGVLAAVVVLVAYRVGVFLLGAAAFVLLGLAFPAQLPPEQVGRILVLALCGLAGGLLARFLERPALSVATAAYGAFMIASALLAGTGPGTLQLPRDFHRIPHGTWFLAVWLLFLVTGAVVQLQLSRGGAGKKGK